MQKHKRFPESQLQNGEYHQEFRLAALPSKKRVDFKLWEEHLQEPIKLTYVKELILFILADGLSQKWIMLKNKSAIRRIFLCITCDLGFPWAKRPNSAILKLDGAPDDFVSLQVAAKSDFWDAGFETVSAFERFRIPPQEEILLQCNVPTNKNKRNKGNNEESVSFQQILKSLTNDSKTTNSQSQENSNENQEDSKTPLENSSPIEEETEKQNLKDDSICCNNLLDSQSNSRNNNNHANNIKEINNQVELTVSIPNDEQNSKVESKDAISLPIDSEKQLTLQDLLLSPDLLLENKFNHLNEQHVFLSAPPICTWPLLALDCEMVLVEGGESALARVSLVDHNFCTVYDRFVKPTKPIIDYLTQFNGITAETLANVELTLEQVHKDLSALIHPETVLVGHSLENDLNALQIRHSKVIDTSVVFKHPAYPEYKHSLKHITKRYLSQNIQQGAHDSVEDAKACMQLLLAKLQGGASFGVDQQVIEKESLATRIVRVSGKSKSESQLVYQSSSLSELLQPETIQNAALLVYHHHSSFAPSISSISQLDNEMKSAYSQLPIGTLMIAVNGVSGVERASEFFVRRRQKDLCWTEGDEAAFQELCRDIRRGFCLLKLKRENSPKTTMTTTNALSKKKNDEEKSQFVASQDTKEPFNEKETCKEETLN